MLHNTTSAEPTLQQLRSLLSGSESDAPDRPALDDQRLRSLIDLATAQRVIGPTVWALHDAGIEPSDDVAALARERFQGAMAWCLELELRLLDVKRWFDKAGGIEFLVLKGAAVAHLDELDPSQRSFADLDLLIHARDMDLALDVLQANGAVRRIPEHHRGFDRRFVKGVGLSCADGIEIDVHRTLCVGALGFRIPLDELFARPDTFAIGGENIAALRLEHRALHAAYHAVIGAPVPALHTLRDLSRYLARPELSHNVLVPEAHRWRGETVLWSAVKATAEVFGPLPAAWHEWADSFSPDERDLDLIIRTQAESPWPIEWSTVRELSWSDRVAYCWEVAWPSAETLAERNQTRWSRLRNGVQALARR